MPELPLGSAGIARPSIAGAARVEDRPGSVWLLEDARGRAAAPMLAIAERLGVEFRRVPLRWSRRWSLGSFSPCGSLRGVETPLPLASGPPLLTLSAGRRAGRVAAWLKTACGSAMVHYGSRRWAMADLTLLDADRAPAPGLLPLLGPPLRLGPLDLQAARNGWHDRLDHLPSPRLAVLLGHGPFGSELRAEEVRRLAAGLAQAMRGAGGSILALAGRSGVAADALAAGLGPAMHLLHRAGEPGPNPELAFLAMSDVILVIGHAGPRLLRACALPVPVYVTDPGPVQPSERRLQKRLIDAGHVRLLETQLGGWRRAALDEAGRAARAVHELLDRAVLGADG